MFPTAKHRSPPFLLPVSASVLPIKEPLSLATNIQLFIYSSFLFPYLFLFAEVLHFKVSVSTCSEEFLPTAHKRQTSEISMQNTTVCFSHYNWVCVGQASFPVQPCHLEWVPPPCSKLIHPTSASVYSRELVVWSQSKVKDGREISWGTPSICATLLQCFQSHAFILILAFS